MPPPLPSATKTWDVAPGDLENLLAAWDSALVCVDCRDERDWPVYRYGICRGIKDRALLLAQDVGQAVTVPTQHPPVAIQLNRITRIIFYDKSTWSAYHITPGKVIAV